MKKCISLLGKNMKFTWKVLKLFSPFLVVALAVLFVFLWGMDRVDSGQWHHPKEVLRIHLFQTAFGPARVRLSRSVHQPCP